MTRTAAPIVFLLLNAVRLNAAEAPSRIHLRIDDQSTFSVAGNVKPMLALTEDQGELGADQRLPNMAIRFAMTGQQQADLEQLLRQQQSPDSPRYHKFLTPEEYGARFGPSAEDVAKVKTWLESEGFSELQVARSRMFISFGGTASEAQRTFRTSIHRYKSSDGEMHYANATEPSLPKALENVAASIRGLHNFTKRPLGVRSQQARFTSSISGNHYLAPGDFAVIYNVQPLYQAGLDGSGVKIAVAGQSDIQLSDIRAFRAAAGLPPNDPTVILTGTDPGIRTAAGDERESDLDVEWAGAIAKNATIVFVTSTDVSTSTSYAIDNNVAPILSLSYGLCEAEMGQTEVNAEAAEYKQANAQGMTIVAAAGDSGAADCDSTYPARRGLAVDVPASLPYVTGIGGTTFNEGSGTYWNATSTNSGTSALSYIPEVAWNDSSTSGPSASGGGASIYNAKPTWQTGAGVPNDGLRDVPDVSFSASPGRDGYLICTNGSCVSGFRDAASNLQVVGGTSCGAPTFAAIVALIVQTSGAQGNINPNLYSLAASTTDVFHDITSGNNMVACRAGSPGCGTGTLGYSAGPGYDQVTGLGSVDAFHMVNRWTTAVPQTATPSPQGPFSFVPITPCRVVDTRNAADTFGGPELAAAATREFDLPSGSCNIPSSAAAYALNVTAVPDAVLNYLSIWPSGQSRPLVSTLNSDGRIKADAAIVPAGTNGGISIYATNQTHAVIDISGYFVPAASSSGDQYFSVKPCRIADTRNSTGALGGPFLTGGISRDFPVLQSGCGVPSTATAYSLNITVVPKEPLLFLTAWPTGQTQPLASILNAPTGTVTANAAIIPAGANGSISAYASQSTDVVIDIDGYFAPPTTGGDYFYALAPCRVFDSRNPAGSAATSGTTSINVVGSGCQVPSTAQSYVLNATVVPIGSLQYLTLWAGGGDAPFVSTLNADPATITSNMAIVPSLNGGMNAYATDSTYLILDLSGYFAP